MTPATRDPGPDFICVGMVKCGTSWLYDQLRAHPDFWMTPSKELHYLDHAVPKMESSKLLYQKYQKTPGRVEARFADCRPLDARDIAFFEQVPRVCGVERDFDRYRSLFRGKGDLLTGDITPAYCNLTGEDIAAIAVAFPSLRVMLLVRDPIARTWSHICMHHRMGKFKAGMLEKPEKFRSYLTKIRGPVRGSYPTRVARAWAQHAPQIPFRYFFFDDIVNQPDKVRSEVLQYLGADPDKQSARAANYNRKSNKKKLELPDDIKIHLIEHFKDELLECAALFGGPAAAWPAQHGY